jgi:hypothetical protein
MKPPKTNARDAGSPQRLVAALVRSTASTIVIGAVAITLFALRKGYHRPEEIGLLVIQNATLFGGIFIALVVWNYWFRGAPKQGVSGRES